MAISDLGTCVKVNQISESNLILAVYFIKHRDRVSRYVNFRNMMLARVKKIVSQREMEEDSTEGSVTTPNIHKHDWLKTVNEV